MLTDRISKIAILALIVVYLGVRLWRLTVSCLWFDEIFSVHAAEHDWSSLFFFVSQDLIHPPLFYVLLKIWIAIGGESLFWLRLLPVLLSALALVPFIYLCRDLKLKTPVTLLSLAFIAVNGSLIKYAQEVRMYSLLLLMSLLSMWLFARYFSRGKSFASLVIVNVLLVYTHYFGWLVVGTEVAAILVFQRIKWLRITAMTGMVLASFVPWLIAVWRAASGGAELSQNIGWMTRPGLRELRTFALDLIEPFYFQASSVEPPAIYFVSVPIMLICLTAVTIYLINWKREDEKRTTCVLALFALVPFVFVFAASWLLPQSIWGTRHLIIVFAPIFLLISLSVSKIAINALRYAAYSAITIFIFAGFINYARTPSSTFIWCSWEPLAKQWIKAPHYSSQPKKLYVFEDLAAYHFWFATRHFPNYRIELVKGIEGLPNDPAYFLPRGFTDISVRDLLPTEGDEFWLSFREVSGRPPVGEHERSTRPFEVPVTHFENLGYTVEDVKKQVDGTQTAYLIKMSRGSAGASPSS